MNDSAEEEEEEEEEAVEEEEEEVRPIYSTFISHSLLTQSSEEESTSEEEEQPSLQFRPVFIPKYVVHSSHPARVFIIRTTCADERALLSLNARLLR